MPRGDGNRKLGETEDNAADVVAAQVAGAGSPCSLASGSEEALRVPISLFTKSRDVVDIAVFSTDAAGSYDVVAAPEGWCTVD